MQDRTCQGSYVRAFASADGSQKWSLGTGGFVEGHPFIGDDGTLYYGSNDGKLYAIEDL